MASHFYKRTAIEDFLIFLELASTLFISQNNYFYQENKNYLLFVTLATDNFHSQLGVYLKKIKSVLHRVFTYHLTLTCIPGKESELTSSEHT